MKRRLAAILAADVVGYSKLMGEDEAGTLVALNKHRRETFDPEVDRHGGRIVKWVGLTKPEHRERLSASLKAAWLPE
jgi:adenylate cyclase